ncbi:hypothetical protein DIPPA_14340, partial [Diplonema papillatum]
VRGNWAGVRKACHLEGTMHKVPKGRKNADGAGTRPPSQHLPPSYWAYAGVPGANAPGGGVSLSQHPQHQPLNQGSGQALPPYNVQAPPSQFFPPTGAHSVAYNKSSSNLVRQHQHKPVYNQNKGAAHHSSVASTQYAPHQRGNTAPLQSATMTRPPQVPSEGRTSQHHQVHHQHPAQPLSRPPYQAPQPQYPPEPTEQEERDEAADANAAKKKKRVKQNRSAFAVATSTNEKQEQLDTAGLRFTRKGLSSCSQKIKTYNAKATPHMQCLFDAFIASSARFDSHHIAMLLQVMCGKAQIELAPVPVEPPSHLVQMQQADLVVLVKKSQRDALWNASWKNYCASFTLSRRRDPAVHSAAFLRAAIAFCMKEADQQKASLRPGLNLLAEAAADSNYPGLALLQQLQTTAEMTAFLPANQAGALQKAETDSIDDDNRSLVRHATQPLDASFHQIPGTAPASCGSRESITGGDSPASAPTTPGVVPVNLSGLQPSQHQAAPLHNAPISYSHQVPQSAPPQHYPVGPCSNQSIQPLHSAGPPPGQYAYPNRASPLTGGASPVTFHDPYNISNGHMVALACSPTSSPPPTGDMTPSMPGSQPHSRTTSLDIDSILAQANQPLYSSSARRPPPMHPPQHNRTISIDSMPQLLSGSPYPPPARGCHSRSGSMESAFPPISTVHSQSPRQGPGPMAPGRRAAHNRTISTDSIGIFGQPYHARTTSQEIPPSLVSELSASPSLCPSPFDQQARPMTYGAPQEGVLSPQPSDMSACGWQEQPWLPPTPAPPPADPYQLDVTTWAVTLDAKASLGSLVALRREWPETLAFMFDGVGCTISEESSSVMLQVHQSQYQILLDAASFVQQHYLCAIQPPQPSQVPQYHQISNPAVALPWDVCVGADVFVLSDVNHVRHHQSTTQGVGCAEDMLSRCGQPAVVCRYDSEDRRVGRCVLRFRSDGAERPWSIYACQPLGASRPLPLPSAYQHPAQVSHSLNPVKPLRPVPVNPSSGMAQYQHPPAPLHPQSHQHVKPNSMQPQPIHPPQPQPQQARHSQLQPQQAHGSQLQQMQAPSPQSQPVHTQRQQQEQQHTSLSGSQPSASSLLVDPVQKYEIILVSAVVAVAACAAREERLPSLPRGLPPRPEYCLNCGVRSSLVTMKQRKGSRLRSYRFECSSCQAQHLQSKESGTCRLAKPDHLATPNSVRNATKAKRVQDRTEDTKQADSPDSSSSPEQTGNSGPALEAPLNSL